MIVKDSTVKMEVDEFGRGFRKRKFISYVDTEPEWNFDGSYKRSGDSWGQSPSKHPKINGTSSEEDENDENRINLYNTKTSSEDDMIDNIADDAIYDPIND